MDAKKLVLESLKNQSNLTYFLIIGVKGSKCFHWISR